jgi:hypothetical protein
MVVEVGTLVDGVEVVGCFPGLVVVVAPGCVVDVVVEPCGPT